jgi:hypothetical protein
MKHWSSDRLTRRLSCAEIFLMSKAWIFNGIVSTVSLCYHVWICEWNCAGRETYVSNLMCSESRPPLHRLAQTRKISLMTWSNQAMAALKLSIMSCVWSAMALMEHECVRAWSNSQCHQSKNLGFYLLCALTCTVSLWPISSSSKLVLLLLDDGVSASTKSAVLPETKKLKRGGKSKLCPSHVKHFAKQWVCIFKKKLVLELNDVRHVDDDAVAVSAEQRWTCTFLTWYFEGIIVQLQANFLNFGDKYVCGTGMMYLLLLLGSEDLCMQSDLVNNFWVSVRFLM